MDLGASLSHSLSHLTDLSNGCFTVFLGSDFLHLSQRKEQGILLRSLHGSAPPVLNVQRWRATMYDTLIMTDRCDRCDRGWSGWTHVWCSMTLRLSKLTLAVLHVQTVASECVGCPGWPNSAQLRFTSISCRNAGSLESGNTSARSDSPWVPKLKDSSLA
jgi:hypothetical protein